MFGRSVKGIWYFDDESTSYFLLLEIDDDLVQIQLEIIQFLIIILFISPQHKSSICNDYIILIVPFIHFNSVVIYLLDLHLISLQFKLFTIFISIHSTLDVLLHYYFVFILYVVLSHTIFLHHCFIPHVYKAMHSWYLQIWNTAYFLTHFFFIY